MSFGKIEIFCLLALSIFANNAMGDDLAVERLVSAFALIEKMQSCTIKSELKAELYPESSGMMTPTNVSETTIWRIEYIDGIPWVYKHRTCCYTSRQWLILSVKEEEEHSIFADKEFVYEWGLNVTATKTPRKDKNIAEFSIESLYKELLEHRKIDLVTDNDQEFVLKVSSSEFLTSFSYIPGIATIIIDKTTGFPLTIKVNSGRSRSSVSFSLIPLAPSETLRKFRPPGDITWGQDTDPAAKSTDPNPN